MCFSFYFFQRLILDLFNSPMDNLNMNTRLFKNLIVALMLSCLFACSSNRLVYNYLDWVITWYIDDYVKLSSQQDDYFNRQLDELLYWHRSDQLLRYAHFVDEVISQINQPVNIEMLQERKKTLRDFMRVLMNRAAPDGIKLLLWLNPDQQQDFYAAGAKKQKRFEKKYLNEPDKDRNKRLYSRMEKLFKRFIGGLTDDQERMVKQWTDDLIPVTSLWLENRSKVMSTFQTVLESSDADAEKYKRLYQLLVEPESLWSAEYRQAIQHNEIITLKMFIEIHGSLTEKQKKHLDDMLLKLKKDFEHLAEQ